MLAGSFYTIVSPVIEPENIRAILKINPDHAIFKGHFPGQPVVPGVCMMQIVKELMETGTGRRLRLQTG
ncbi:MAG: 3-hydroxyacyl-ACP dehydratase, partial [Bacteroidota bacterium]